VEVKKARLRELKPGMVTLEDIRTNNGVLLLSRGQEITDRILGSLHKFSQTVGLKDIEFSIMTVK